MGGVERNSKRFVCSALTTVFDYLCQMEPVEMETIGRDRSSQWKNNERVGGDVFL